MYMKSVQIISTPFFPEITRPNSPGKSIKIHPPIGLEKSPSGHAESLSHLRGERRRGGLHHPGGSRGLGASHRALVTTDVDRSVGGWWDGMMGWWRLYILDIIHILVNVIIYYCLSIVYKLFGVVLPSLHLLLLNTWFDYIICQSRV